MVQLKGCYGKIWAKLKKKKSDIKAIFWGAISYEFCSKLAFIDGYMNSDKYIGVLNTHLGVNVAVSDKDDTIFQKDNVPCHTSKETKKFFEAQDIQIFDWPPNSPNLNPIEKFWALLKRRIINKQAHNKYALIQKAEESWNEISQEIISNVIDFMPRRIQACIENQGDLTLY